MIAFKKVTFEYDGELYEWSFVCKTMRHSGFITFLDAATEFNRLVFES